MRRLTVGAAIASLVTVGAAAGPAAAKPKHKPSPRAHVYRAILGPVAVGPYGMVPNTRGRAQLVDGKRNDKLSIHVRGLQAGQAYEWHIHKAPAGITDPCASPAAAATPVPGWIYRPLTADAAGNANSQARSFSFTADPAATYYVDVHMADGSTVVCGVLGGKRKQKPAKPNRGKSKPTTVVAQPPAGGAQDEPFVVGAEGQAGTGTTTGSGATTGTGTTAGTTPGTTTTSTQTAPPPAELEEDGAGRGKHHNGGDRGKKGPRRPHRGGHGRR